jgi:hypothetical protein
MRRGSRPECGDRTPASGAFRASGIGENRGRSITGGFAMQEVLVWIGRLAGIAGVALCGVAVAARALGAFWLGGFQVGTLLQVGVAAMVLGCLSFLAALTERLKTLRP